MKPFSILITLYLACLLFSCNNASTNTPAASSQQQAVPGENTPPSELNFAVDAQTITKDFSTWYNYTYANIRLAQDFIGLDADSSPVHKAVFLDRILNNNLIPLKTKTQGGVAVYQLHRLPRPNKDIQLTLRQMAATEKEHSSMEGKPLPPFALTDLDGRRYDKKTVQGKTLLLKCWFINCVACVQEFPKLNALVERYRNNPDVLFVSLAPDSRKALSSFLQSKPFRYAVVPEQGAYMTGQLGITAYPTHLLVDKTGKIVKVTNSMDDMLPFFEKLTGNSSP